MEIISFSFITSVSFASIVLNHLSLPDPNLLRISN